MRIDDDRKEQVREFLRDRTSPIGECPMCHKTDWRIHEELFELRTFEGGGLVVGGKVLPLLVLYCDYCGNTQLMNAVRCKAVPPEQRDSAPKGDAAGKEPDHE